MSKYENVKIFRGIEIDTIAIIQNFIFLLHACPIILKSAWINRYQVFQP